MTYFHTGIRTIIGAKSFHCPVRDGKEWFQLAMVIRQNFVTAESLGLGYRIHRVNQFLFSFGNYWVAFLNASTWHNSLDRSVAKLDLAREISKL